MESRMQPRPLHAFLSRHLLWHLFRVSFPCLFFFAVPTAPFSICSKFLAFPEKRRREKGEMTAGVCMHNEDRRRPGNKETSRWQSDCILRVSTCPANKQTKAIETICYESHISILQIGGLSRKLGTGIGSIKRWVSHRSQLQKKYFPPSRLHSAFCILHLQLKSRPDKGMLLRHIIFET